MSCLHQRKHYARGELSGKGKIFSYCVVHVPLPGFQAPYIIAQVQIPEGPRINSLITGCEPVEGSLNIGTEVELVVCKITETKEGNDVIGFMFRPIKNQ